MSYEWCTDPDAERRAGEAAARRGWLTSDERERVRDGDHYGDDCNREFAKGVHREQERIEYERIEYERREDERREDERREEKHRERERIEQQMAEIEAMDEPQQSEPESENP